VNAGFRASLIEIWERGEALEPIDRALALLDWAHPGRDGAELASFDICKRDVLLFLLHEKLFGRRAFLFQECPRCATELEFELDLQELQSDSSAESHTAFYKEKDTIIEYRAPNSLDLARVAREFDSEESLLSLLKACVISAQDANGNDRKNDLSELSLRKLGKDMEGRFPDLEISLLLDCPSCREKFRIIFDIAEFLWTKISRAARNLLQETATLARYYGWTESEILSLSDRRRKFYLEAMNA